MNGCCGNIHHANHLNPDPMPDHKQMGSMLAESSKRALEDMTEMDTSLFACSQSVLPIPRREIPGDMLEKAREMLRKHPEPLWKDAEHVRVEWDWVYAVGIMDIADERSTNPTYPYEIQALRIGDFALLSLMGEPFVEAQLAIKLHSPFEWTQVAHMCNGYLGYVPTKHAFAGGGYETRSGRGSRLDENALEMIENASLKQLKQLSEAPA